jgi:hypothetical protein
MGLLLYLDKISGPPRSSIVLIGRNVRGMLRWANKARATKRDAWQINCGGLGGWTAKAWGIGGRYQADLPAENGRPS